MTITPCPQHNPHQTAANIHAPLILQDTNEPFPFTHVAISTGLTPGQKSPTSNITIAPHGDTVIEYALWSDLEIGHAYELEHIWLHLTHNLTRITHAYGSAHGTPRPLHTPQPGNPTHAYSEPGKHGFAATPHDWAGPRDAITTLCTSAAGIMGIYANPHTPQPTTTHQYRQAWNHLRAHRFNPTWQHTRQQTINNLTRIDPHNLTSDWKHTRASTAIRNAPSDYVRVPAGEWGDPAVDAWVARINTSPTGKLHSPDTPNKELTARTFQEITAAHKMLILLCDTPQTAESAQHNAFNAWASSYTITALQNPHYGQPLPNNPAPLTTTALPTPHQLCITPDGDIDIPPRFLQETTPAHVP